MSLLDTASLIVTPNAYKEGKLYSVIPSDGSGDFTFTRATTATRVNSSGLVELVPYNLLTYSEQLSNWTNIQFVTVTDNVETAPNGTLTASRINETAVTNVHRLFLNPTVSANKHTYSVYLKAGTRNWAFLRLDGLSIDQRTWFDIQNGTIGTTSGDHTATIEDAGNGWYRCSVSIAGTTYDTTPLAIIGLATANGVFNYAGDVNEYIYAWGAQLVEGTNALPYQKTETRLNIPRIDYSLGGCPNILLEPQRTNLATYSEQFDDASWNKINSSVTANADISPDGYTNADRIYDNATSGQHRVGKNISVVSATTYTFSVFAKKGSLRYCYLFTVAGGASDRYYFDLQDGVSITAGGKIEDYGSGWYRISAQVTAAATGNELFAFNLTDSSSSPTYSGTGTGYHMIYGYQVEAGDYATSYIPTTTASVTRNKDTTVEKDLTSFGIGNSYTLLFDLTMATEDSNKILFYLKNSAGADSFTFRNFSGILSVYDAIGLTYPLAALANESTKWAFRFDGVNYSLFRVSGGVAVKNTATLGTARNIGYLNSFNISGTKASLKLLAIEPSALTDAECEQFVIS